MYTTIISTAALAQHLAHPDWIILDCRFELSDPEAGTRRYTHSHLPGARYVHLDQALSGPKTGADGLFRGRHPLPERERLLEKMRAWGISGRTQVVAYDDAGGMYAARLWVLLRWLGHQAVAVLDGGWQAWEKQKLPLTPLVPDPVPGDLRAGTALIEMLTVQDVLANLESGQRQLVDARSPARFRGEGETMDPAAGHIPGAKNRFYQDNLDENGCFKPAQQLRQEWGEVIDAARSAVMQCGSGVTACHNVLALEIAGLSGAALYPGSWSEWCADPARPTAVTV